MSCLMYDKYERVMIFVSVILCDCNYIMIFYYVHIGMIFNNLTYPCTSTCVVYYGIVIFLLNKHRIVERLTRNINVNNKHRIIERLTRNINVINTHLTTYTIIDRYKKNILYK